jgi:hypothetical protein
MASLTPDLHIYNITVRMATIFHDHIIREAESFDRIRQRNCQYPIPLEWRTNFMKENKMHRGSVNNDARIIGVEMCAPDEFEKYWEEQKVLA